MEKRKKEIVKMLLNQNLEEKDEEEIIDLLVNNPITIDVDKENDEKMGIKLRINYRKLREVGHLFFCFVAF